MFGELCSAFTRSFYSYQLLVMVIKYIPSARHQLLGSGAPQRGLAGSWELGRGIALPGWLACSLAWRAAVLAAMCKAEEFQASSVPRPAPEESREKCCGAWLRGALAGRASSCLSGSHERRGSSGKPEHPRLISLFFSFSLLLLLTSLSFGSEVSCSEAGSPNNTALP